MSTNYAKLGLDCEFLLNNTVVTNVTDVTVELSCDEADVTTRGNSGWKQTLATLRDCSIDLSIYEIADDYAYTTFKTAFLASGSSRLVRVTCGGVTGMFAVTKFSREEPLAEAVKISVSLKMAQFISAA